MNYQNNSAARQEITNGLSKILADSTRLYSKTHICHWNVEGPHFGELHVLFETLYNDMWLSLDLIAERLRALGIKIPVSSHALLSLCSLKEMDQDLDEKAMLAMLIEDFSTLVSLMSRVSLASEKGEDRATTDLLTVRIQVLEKHIWMLKASLK